MSHQILHAPSRYGPSAKHYLIFFITGNPGLIAYYNGFLDTLNYLLSPADLSGESPDPAFHIFGQSLPGFEDDDATTSSSIVDRSGPYGLKEVIDLTFDLLTAQSISNGDRKGDSFDGIILIGHSVGTYILLELLRKIRQKLLSQSLKVKAGILLFPTVTHLAQSPSGIKFSALFRIPDFPRVASILIRGLFWPLPRVALKWLVKTVTRMPKDAADATKNLLVGKRALWQALHLARDELEMITEDRWDENVWGVEHFDLNSKEAIPKLVFYFGKKDHWVADHTRDALIGARGKAEGQKTGKPKMLIDQDGIPHAFCIKHGELVAEKVKVWIEEILRSE